MQSIFDIKKEEDLYSVLGCVDTSSLEQIKTEYKRLALLYHPDKSPNQETKFERIKSAYDILGDPVRKAQYDRWKASGLIIPFVDFVQLGTHAQTVHWQTLPSQQALTNNDSTKDASSASIRLPPTISKLPRVHIESNSFWKMKDYTINDRP